MTVRVAVVTPAQRDVIRELTFDGASNGEIAERLGLSVDTVKSHLRVVLAAAGCPNRTALVVALLRDRLKLRTEDHRGEWARQ